MLRIGVLGALDATIEASGTVEVLDLGGPRQRSVLALLLVARGQVVSVDRLVEDLWHGEPPPRAIGALQAYVSHLRRVLEPGRAPRTPAAVLVSEPPGYAVRRPAGAVDAWRFESLVRQASDPERPEDARELLQQGLDLWRGPAFGEFAAESWAVAEAARLDGLRIVARERWCEAVLRAGDANEAVMTAEALTREHPLREEGWRLLAMGLYAGGRQADALTALRRARDILADELGMDPGQALLQVEADVLAQRLAMPAARSPSIRPAARATTVGPPAEVAEPAGRGRPSDPDRDVARLAEPVEERSAFIGRENELNTLHSLAVEAVDRSDRRVALIAGDAGAGKSRLLGRLTRELSVNGWRVIVGRCPESDGAPPAWAWVEAIRALAADVDPGPQAPAMAALLDETASTATQADASFGRFLMSRAVTGYLCAAARTHSLAVVIDDLHRGDSETLALLEGVATGASGVPLLLIAAYRPAEVTPGLRDALAGLAALHPSRLGLGGLDPAHAARLIRSVAGVQPDSATLSALVERTGGNPFYLTESARLLGSEGSLVATSKVPEGVRDVLRRRFARLPEVTVSVLRLAAVIGRDVDIDVLVRAAEVDEDTVLDALEAAVLAGLLSEPAQGSVRFGHVLVRDTLYDDAPRLRRGRWHARVGAALEALHPHDVAALAYHFHQAGTAATARRAANYDIRAADQAVSRYAHETAAALYEQALADLDRVPAVDPDHGPSADADLEAGVSHLAERVEVLARLTRSQIAAGASIAAAQTRRKAIRLADQAGRRDLLVRVLTSWDLPTPWITRQYGTVDTAVTELIEEALGWSDPELLDGAARCRLLCALVAEVGGESENRATEAADEAEGLAREIGDPVLIGLALHALIEVTSAELQTDLRVKIGNELLQIGAAPGLAVFALIGHHVLLGSAAIRLDFAGMAEQIDRLAALVRRYRWRQAEGTIEMHRGLLAHLTGRLDDAEVFYARGGDLLRASGAIDADGIVLLAFLSLRITQGRVAELWNELEGVISASDVMADLIAFPLTATGRFAQAREARRSIRPVRRDFFHSFLLTLRGMIVAILQDPVEAATVYPELLPYAGQISGVGTASYAAGPVDTVLGDLALLLGRPADATAHYGVALSLSRQCGNDYWAQQADARLASG